MSRYVTVRTQLREMPLLRETLQCMGCSVEEGMRARMLAGGSKVEMVVQTPGGTLGFTQAGEGPIGVVGMEEVLKHDACTQFLQQVTQQYARRKVIAQAEKAGYRLVEETVDDDRAIRLVVRKW